MLTIKGISLKSNNGIDLSYDNKLLLERIGRIIMTHKKERVNNPDFGSLLEDFLFQRGVLLEQHIYSNLINTVEVYEPRVRVTDVNISFNDVEHSAYVRIEVQRRDTFERLEFEEYIAI